MTTLQYPQSIVVDLDLEKVSLCNQGVNSRAHILLTKRKENESMPKTFEEFLKALTDEQAAIVNKHMASIEVAKDTIIAELQKSVADLTGERDELKKAIPVAPEKEDIMKSAPPELVEYINKLQGSVAELVADKEEALAKARFEEVKALPVDETELKTVLKAVSPAVFEILKKAANAVESSVLNVAGKETPNDFVITADTAYAQLEKSANTIMAEDAALTFEQAFMKACVNDPATYAKYTKGER